mmetsp:Transcript_32351/g.37190  ORF Transcript_32351/g.37190 Transcript_32351/m.37190 type:complete len:421 (+) Transcript_32351:120-1382(+)
MRVGTVLLLLLLCVVSSQWSVVTAKKIVVYFDGSADSPLANVPKKDAGCTFSNVLKLHLLSGGDINGDTNDNCNIPGQISLYEQGIGTKSRSKIINKLGAGLGILWRQKRPMLRKLERVYEKGDTLYIVGFSRGAAVARQFASKLNKRGLRTKDGEHIDSPPIEFVGCFETVAEQLWHRLHIDLWHRFKKIRSKSKQLGENGEVAPNVKKAVHLVVLDDNRMFGPTIDRYPPILMGLQNTTRVTETWFAGEHGDSGGGGYTKGLPDCACEYMQEWMENSGIEFKTFDEISINECIVIDGHDDAFNNVDLSRALSIVCNATEPNHLSVHAQKALENPSYRPVIVTHFDKIIPDATISIHQSVLEHMKAWNEYVINPEVKQVIDNVIIVGSLGTELEDETREFVDLVEKRHPAGQLLEQKQK